MTQRYSNYKESGIEWIGEVPEHWGVMKNKFILKYYKGKNPKSFSDNANDKVYLTMDYLRDRDVTHQYIGNTNDLYPVDENELLLLWDGANAGEFLLSKKGYLSSTMAHIIFNDSINKTYGIFYSKVLETQIRKFTIGMGIPHVNSSELNSRFFVLPPLHEQICIANYLSEKSNCINAAIRIKEQQINLLKEYRQIAIHQAVTKGLDETVKMKDSGIDWMGEIPEHWEVIPIKYAGFTQNGISKGGEFFGKGFPFISYSDVYKNDTLPPLLSGLAEVTPEELKLYSIKAGDILFTRTSETIQEIGLSSVALQDYPDTTFAGFLIRFRFSQEILLPLYSKYYFRSETHRPFFVGTMNIVIRASLSQETLKKLPLLKPPIAEQAQIVAHLEALTAKTDAAIRIKEQQIEELKQYKASLINEVVTGKIKVCN